MRILIVLLSAILLLSLGFLIFTYYRGHFQPSLTILTSTGPVTQEPVSLTLNLASPDDNLLVFDPDILIEGKTTPGSTALLSFDDNDQVINVNNTGDFSATAKLQSGINQFIITVFDESGNTKTEERTVFYSTEKI